MRLMVASTTLALAPMLLAQQSKPPEVSPDSANAALAERVAQMGQFAVSGKLIVPETLRLSAALLESAARLNPSEPRFLHLLTEAYLQLGGEEGRKGAIDALTRYRALQPADLVAQAQLIDLYYAGIDNAADAKTYLDRLLDEKSVSPTVKAHVAVLAAKLAEERAEPQAAEEYVDQALKLMPLSLEALQQKYARLDPTATTAERVELLLGMIRSNPVQPAVMLELASELANAGLVDPSLNWYQQAFELQNKMNMRPGIGDSTAFAAELVIADQLRAADPVLREILHADPGNAEAALLLLLIDQRAGNAAGQGVALGAARDALMVRLGRLSDQLNGRQPAQGAAPPAPEIAADVQKLQQEPNKNLVQPYAAALADLAWLDIYFARKPADAEPAMQALRQLVPADAGILARLEGWSYLVDGKKDEAKVKLSAVADRDPLSALGMLKTEDNPDVVARQGRQLLNANADGVVGAVLIEALRGNFGLMPAGPNAAAIRQKLSDFPRAWLDILDPSRVKDFYSLRAEPKKVSHDYSEPMIATVTISNVGNFDITVGPEGTIRQDLWFDVQIRGMNNESLSGVAIERIGQSMLLKPKESITVDVRVDQDGLLTRMQAEPLVLMPLFFSVITNPMTQSNGVAPGPCGYRAQFGQVLNRRPSQLKPETVQDLFKDLQAGKGAAQLVAIDKLNMFANMLKAQQDPDLQKKGDEIADMIRKAKGDPNPAVASYAMLTAAMRSDLEIRAGALQQMLEDGDFGQKVLAAVGIHLGLPPEQRQQRLAPATQPSVDPLIRKLAQSVIDVAALPAPTTAPAAQEPAPSTPGTPTTPATPAKPEFRL
jgi:hypothetical protein